MSHHHGGFPEENQFNHEELKSFFINKAEWPKLGATGNFPNGKINDEDEGQIAIGIAHTEEGKIIMNFGKAVKWIGFTKEEAKVIAESLLKHAE